MKRIPQLLAIVVLAGVAWLTMAGQAHSDVIIQNGDTYAAIAYSPATGKYGYANNYRSRGAAEKAALRHCPAEDARIVAWVNNGFVALALGDDQNCWGIGYSYGNGANTTYAGNRALAECQKRTTGVRVVVCVCSQN